MTGSGLSLAQERALAINPKIMSSFSIPSSVFIMYEVYCDHKSRGTTPIQRALVGMSIVDIMASSAWFMSTWAVPEGSFAYAAGNRTTCNYQGFLLQLAIGAPLYNSSLALFYLLMIKLRWSDERLARIERWVHGFILTFTVGTSILLLHLEQYNHIGAVCWVIGEPVDCGNSSWRPGDVPCERGNYAWLYGVVLFYGPLWICVIACMFSMVVLYLEVRKTHRLVMRHSNDFGQVHSLNRSGSDSNRVAIQAILYSLSFIITWMPSTLWSIAHWFNWSHYGLDIAAATAEPLQGFWNLLIFLKNRPSTTLKIRRALATTMPFMFSPPNSTNMRVSFASGLRSNGRCTGSRFSAEYSSSVLTTEKAPPKKQAQRNTATTEALDEANSDSLHRLADDTLQQRDKVKSEDALKDLDITCEVAPPQRSVTFLIESLDEDHNEEQAPQSPPKEEAENFEVAWA